MPKNKKVMCMLVLLLSISLLLQSNFVNSKNQVSNDTFKLAQKALTANKPFATYLGGSIAFGLDSKDFITAVAYDSDGNMIVVGYTGSSDFPTTVSAMNDTFNGGSTDGFIAKISKDGSALIFSTFIGGSSKDQVNAVAVLSDGKIVVAGDTYSSDFPTTAGTIDESFNDQFSQSDCFITVFSSDGSSIISSTFFGGSNGDHAWDLGIDSNENIYITGHTHSDNLPTTSGVVNETYYPSFADTFVAKFSKTCDVLHYSTYLGGNGNDYVSAIDVDDHGNVYITGETNSDDFPLTNGAYKTNHSGEYEIFVTKFGINATELVYSTLIGKGTGNDIKVQQDGSIIIAGETPDINFPVTDSSSFNGGTKDVFISKITTTGSELLFSSLLGGADEDTAYALITNDKYVFITGVTSSSDFLTTDNATIDDNACFLSIYDVSSKEWFFSSILGNGVGKAITLDSEDYIYIGGYTTSKNFPTTPGSYDESFNAQTDGFCVKYYFNETSLIGTTTIVGFHGNNSPAFLLLPVIGLIFIFSIKRKR